MKALAVILGLVACDPVPPPKTPAKPVAPSAELSPALQPLAWWEGTWTAKDGFERWVAAGGALYGVALHDDASWEVMIVDDADGPGPADGILRFLAMPNGAPWVEFRERTRAMSSTTKLSQIVFANDQNDFPSTISYVRTGDALAARLDGTLDVKAQVFDFTLGAAQPAPALEKADRAFSDDTAKRKVEGWVDAFAPTGKMMRKTGAVERAAIADFMRETLAEGVLAWAPIASGMRGDLGFTVGTATYVKAGTTAVDWRSSYVTIWQRQPDDAWKVLFDVGRVVNE